MNKVMKKLLLAFLLSGCTGSTSLHVENDIFNPISKNEDRYFTHGTKITHDRGDKAYSVGQNIYTPGQKRLETLQPDDRPYAGYTYGELLFREHPAPNQSFDIAIQAGLIGPGSGAKEVQCFIHDLVDNYCPAGWEHALHNEPTLNILFSRKLRTEPVSISKLHADLIPYWEGALGNVHTGFGVGSVLRLGYNLPNDFGPNFIIPKAPYAESNFDSSYNFGAYYFLKPSIRGVLRNIFLDGNTWRDSHSVDKKPVVGEVQTGISLTYKQFTLTYSISIETKEFDKQPKPWGYGAIDLNWRWN